MKKELETDADRLNEMWRQAGKQASREERQRDVLDDASSTYNSYHVLSTLQTFFHSKKFLFSFISAMCTCRQPIDSSDKCVSWKMPLVFAFQLKV